MKKYNKPCFFICIVILFQLVFVCCGENVKKSIDNTMDNNDDIGDNEDSKDAAMEIPSDLDASSDKRGRVPPCNTRRQNSHMHAIKNAALYQFPFIASLMSLSDEHLCTGSIISNSMFLTTATCVEKQISHAVLNTVKLKSGNKDEVRVSVIKSEKFPSFTGKSSLNDVGIVYTHRINSSTVSKIKISDYTSAQKLVDIEVFGFGLNEEVAHAKSLQYVGLENRFYQETDNTIKAYIDCVESKEPVCFKDVGGPAILGSELIGVVIKGQDQCTKEMTADYAVSKEMATILPAYNFKSWLEDKIKKNEEALPDKIPTYPSKLVADDTETLQSVLRKGSSRLELEVPVFTISILVCMLSLHFH